MGALGYQNDLESRFLTRTSHFQCDQGAAYPWPVEALTYVLAANRVTGMVAMQLRARGTWGFASDGIHDAAFLVVA